MSSVRHGKMDDGMCYGDEKNHSRCCTGYVKIEGKCKPCIGAFGVNCTSKCIPGYYGKRCLEMCNCPYDQCHVITGCSDEHSVGWLPGVAGASAFLGILLLILLTSIICKRLNGPQNIKEDNSTSGPGIQNEHVRDSVLPLDISGPKCQYTQVQSQWKRKKKSFTQHELTYTCKKAVVDKNCKNQFIDDTDQYMNTDDTISLSTGVHKIRYSIEGKYAYTWDKADVTEQSDSGRKDSISESEPYDDTANVSEQMKVNLPNNLVYSNNESIGRLKLHNELKTKFNICQVHVEHNTNTDFESIYNTVEEEYPSYTVENKTDRSQIKAYPVSTVKHHVSENYKVLLQKEEQETAEEMRPYSIVHNL